MNNHRVKIQLIQQFWSTVSKHSKNLSAIWGSHEKIKAFFDAANKPLKKINEHLTLELGHLGEDQYEITISADGIEEAFSDVEEIYKQKPELDNLVIHKFRQPISNLSKLLIKVDDTEVIYSDILFELLEEKAGIIIVLFIPGFQEESSEHETLKFLVLDTCLGEYDAVKKVLYCDALNLENYSPRTMKSITTLREEFNKIYKSKYAKAM